MEYKSDLSSNSVKILNRLNSLSKEPEASTLQGCKGLIFERLHQVIQYKKLTKMKTRHKCIFQLIY